MSKPQMRRDIEVSAVYDIETEKWDRFVVGGMLTADGAYIERSFRKEDSFVDMVLGVRGTIWAHAGGRFDNLWLLDHIAKRKIPATVMAAGSRVVCIEIEGLRICDSAALVPMSLAKFTKGMGTEKKTLTLPCACGDECGGYCTIARDMSRTHYRQLTEYLEADCASLFGALKTLRDFAADNDLDLAMTIGASAWRNAKRKLGLPGAILGRGQHAFARAGYYGGRTQLYRPGKTALGYEFDVNSMYPFALSEFALPVGEPTLEVSDSARRRYSLGSVGFYKAVVKVPEMHLPPLPLRYDNRSRTSYPTGEFAGTWPLPELIHAEERGATVRVIEGLCWSNAERIFGTWFDKIFALRRKLDKKSPIGTFLKLYMASLSGKLGMNPETDEYIVCPSKVDFCNSQGACRNAGVGDCLACCIYHCNGACGAFRALSDYAWTRKIYRISDCSHVEWTGYATSHSRVLLNKQQISVNNGEDCIYSDTDGIFSINKRTINIGKNLGQWDYGGAVLDFEGFAPKCYTFRRGIELADGGIIAAERVTRAKGVRIKARPYSDNAQVLDYDVPRLNAPYKAAGIAGFKSGARAGKFFAAKKATRTITRQYGDRILLEKPLGHIVTRAPRIEELAK